MYERSQFPVGQGRLTIQVVKVDSNNTLLVTTRFNDSPDSHLKSIHVNGAIIRDSKGNSVYVDETADATLTNTDWVPIKVRYDTLPAGNYAVILVSEDGGSYVSPAFTIGE